MDAKRELERISLKAIREVWGCPVECKSVKLLKTKVAQVILAKLPELGFVRLEDVEIGKDKTYTLLRRFIIDYHNDLRGQGKTKYNEQDVQVYDVMAKQLATAIYQAKGVIKVKK